MFFSQTSRKPANSRVHETWRAHLSRYHASFPSWPLSVVLKGPLPSTAPIVIACLLFQFSPSILSERATASTPVSCTSSSGVVRYRIALNTELHAPASLPRAQAARRRFATTSIASHFCSSTQERRARGR